MPCRELYLPWCHDFWAGEIPKAIDNLYNLEILAMERANVTGKNLDTFWHEIYFIIPSLEYFSQTWIWAKTNGLFFIRQLVSHTSALHKPKRFWSAWSQYATAYIYNSTSNFNWLHFKNRDTDRGLTDYTMGKRKMRKYLERGYTWSRFNRVNWSGFRLPLLTMSCYFVCNIVSKCFVISKIVNELYHLLSSLYPWISWHASSFIKFSYLTLDMWDTKVLPCCHALVTTHLGKNSTKWDSN